MIVAIMVMMSTGAYGNSNCDMQMPASETTPAQAQTDEQMPCHEIISNSDSSRNGCCDSGSCHCMVLSPGIIQPHIKSSFVNWTIQLLNITQANQLPEIYIPSNFRPPIA